MLCACSLSFDPTCDPPQGPTQGWHLAAASNAQALPDISLCTQLMEPVLVLMCTLCALQAFHEMLSSKTKLVAMVHVSNMLGCILPAAQVAEAAHKVSLHAQSCPVAAPP